MVLPDCSSRGHTWRITRLPSADLRPCEGGPRDLADAAVALDRQLEQVIHGLVTTLVMSWTSVLDTEPSSTARSSVKKSR